eukprot:5704000-Amphidinium_carterae.1
MDSNITYLAPTTSLQANFAMQESLLLAKGSTDSRPLGQSGCVHRNYAQTLAQASRLSIQGGVCHPRLLRQDETRFWPTDICSLRLLAKGGLASSLLAVPNLILHTMMHATKVHEGG